MSNLSPFILQKSSHFFSESISIIFSKPIFWYQIKSQLLANYVIHFQILPQISSFFSSMKFKSAFKITDFCIYISTFLHSIHTYKQLLYFDFPSQAEQKWKTFIA